MRQIRVVCPLLAAFGSFLFTACSGSETGDLPNNASVPNPGGTSGGAGNIATTIILGNVGSQTDGTTTGPANGSANGVTGAGSASGAGVKPNVGSNAAVGASSLGGSASLGASSTTSTAIGASLGGAQGAGVASGTTATRACTDTPRPSESCKNAKDWGFCGQAWFAGNCDATCGICSMGSVVTVGTGSSAGNAQPGSATPPGSSTPAGNSSTGSGNVSGGTGTSGTSTGGSATGGNSAPSTPQPPASQGTRVDNPYVGVTGYINPEWKARADAETGGSRISSYPTGVWMDRIAAISGTGSSSAMGLRDHMDEAVAQKAGYIQIVIYDLPGRDCAALSSNGELGPTEIDRYKKEYIDPIAAIESDPKYAALRIINIIEIDSLPNLVTNTGGSKSATATCDTMKANGNYQRGIQYALSQLFKAGNTYNYVDAGHHGWIGWDDNFDASTRLFYETASAADGGVATVTGFITNTANYSALEEPYLTVNDTTRASKWIDWNRYVDELTFAKAMRTKLVGLGFLSNIGMIIDTSRNGWGGPNRPKAASTATDVNTMIDESRIDRRIHTGNWCNQSGAGLGERPRAVNADGIDAYVWIKPPGESDGASQFVANDQNKGVDGMCDPTYAGNARNGNSKSGALGDAPLSGAWFSSQFQELMANAYPPLQ